MAVVTGNTTTRLGEADANFSAGRVSVRPPGNNPRAFMFSGTTGVITQTAGNRFFAMRNTSPITAMVVRLLQVNALTDVGASPAAQAETGVQAFILRRWTGLSGTFISNASMSAVTPPNKRTRMERSRVADANSTNMSPWDIRLCLVAQDIIRAEDQVTADAQPFLDVRSLELLNGATVPKDMGVFAEFNARVPGTYPIVLEPFEGIGIAPAITWASMRAAVHVEWEEVPMNELEQFV